MRNRISIAMFIVVASAAVLIGGMVKKPAALAPLKVSDIEQTQQSHRQVVVVNPAMNETMKSEKGWNKLAGSLIRARVTCFSESVLGYPSGRDSDLLYAGVFCRPTGTNFSVVLLLGSMSRGDFIQALDATALNQKEIESEFELISSDKLTDIDLSAFAFDSINKEGTRETIKLSQTLVLGMTPKDLPLIQITEKGGIVTILAALFLILGGVSVAGLLFLGEAENSRWRLDGGDHSVNRINIRSSYDCG